MQIRWQIWFLLTFVICASATIFYSMTSGGRGEEKAMENWSYVTQKGHSSLADYCKANGLKISKEVLRDKRDIFSEENPLICAQTQDEAKKLYAEYAQLQAKEISTKITFGFIGLWVLIILGAGLLVKIAEKKEKDRAEREGEY